MLDFLKISAISIDIDDDFASAEEEHDDNDEIILPLVSIPVILKYF